MRKFAIGAVLVASLTAVAGFSTPSRADTGQVAVVFTKGGFIVGVGGGEGVLLYRGKKYPFTVSGMSVGFTIGAINLRGPGLDRGLLPCAGGALAASKLQNANDVILSSAARRWALRYRLPWAESRYV